MQQSCSPLQVALAASFRDQPAPHPYSECTAIYGSDAYRRLLAAASANAGDAITLRCGYANLIVFMLEVLHPLSEGPQGLIIDIAGDIPAFGSEWREELLQRLRDHVRRRGWKSLATCLFPAEAELFTPSGAKSSTSLVRKVYTKNVPELPQTGLQIRQATINEHTACLKMLSEAYRAGMAALGLAERREDIRRLAEEALDRSTTTGDGLHLVARIDGAIAGHAIGFLNSQCLRTGIVDAELVDVFTSYTHRSRGYAAALTAHWENTARQHGATSVRGTVSGSDRIAILRGLVTHGWAEYARECPVLY